MENFEWNNLSLGEPHWLFLLLLLPGVLWLSRRKKKTQAIKFPSIVEIKKTRKSWKTKLLWLPKLFFYLGLILTVLSISRPRLDQSTQRIVSSGVDIVLGVDLSASMLALDMSPSPSEPNTRLDVVKEVIQEFIEKRKYDRIGLVAFAVDPYLVSALTLDKEYLQSNLARLKVGLTEQTGTNIGSVLAEGINRLRTLESKSKILILLTDGKDEPAPKHSPIIFAEGAKKDKIKIYTIAIGASTRTRTYLYDPNARDIMRYANGTPVVEVAEYPVDKEILQEIAQRTEAKFFEAGDKTTLRSIYDEIDQLEKTDIQLEVNALYGDLYQWPLASGFILLVVGFLLERSIFLRIP
ncbi:MAG: VWA domain-containing protein [Verrucomicrobia bacterium]|nr:VWA domain-containing protein [Verrucomicrobiota bacterium]